MVRKDLVRQFRGQFPVPTWRRRITSPPTTLSSRSSGTARTAWMPSSNPPRSGPESVGSCCASSTWTSARSTAARPMRLAQPDPPFAHRRHPLGAHAKGEFGHKDFLGVVVFVDRALIGLRELRRG
jgi:hypothetical protein